MCLTRPNGFIWAETNTSPQGSGKQIMSNLAKKQTVATETATLTVVKEIPANGKTVVIEEAVAEVVPEVKEEVKTPAPVIKPVPVLTLEQKLEKIDELNRIIAKYQRLQEARKNLNTFKIGSDGLNLTITIKDASGQEFKTSHNIVVETVLSSVRQILNERISDVEKDITFTV